MYRLVRDGVELSFLDVGRGAPPLVLVHDLASDHTDFSEQVEHYRRRHRVVAADLRGHGESGKPEQQYGVDCFADDVAWLCYELGLYSPVIIGYGLGGMVGLELSARYPDLPSAVVALDSSLVPLSRTADVARWAGGAPMPDGDLLPAQSPFGGAAEVPSAGARLGDGASETAGAASRHAVASAWESILAWEGATAAAACRVPLFFVDARYQHADPASPADARSTAGHSRQLPRQINGVLDSVLSTLSIPSP